MSRLRPVVALVVLALLGSVLGPAAGADTRQEDREPASPSGSGSTDLQRSLQIRTNTTAAVTAGDTAWITVSIRGRTEVDDVRATATLDGGSVGYPTNTVDHSGPYNGYHVDDQETDYLAFRVTAPGPERRRQMVDLELAVSWTEDGQPRSGSHVVKVPVVVFDGEPYEMVTDEVALTGVDDGWVRISLAGLAPRVEGVRLTVVEPTGLDLAYPQETFTSLQRDDLLEDGETDEARFRLGETHWGQTLSLEIRVDYTVDGAAASRTHRVTVSA
jgi:hypothetical protein